MSFWIDIPMLISMTKKILKKWHRLHVVQQKRK